MKTLKILIVPFLLAINAYNPFYAQESQHQKVQIRVGTTIREFTLYIPLQLPDNSALLISFSGMNQTDDFQADQAKYWMVADTAKFVVVYPRPVNPSSSWDMTGNLDLNFTTAIIDTIYSRYKINKKRVYISGFSWGGNFCYRIANQIGDKIAAIAPTMGHTWGSNPNVAISPRPMPILQIMGTADDVFRLENVQSVLNKWIERNECSTRSRLTEPYPEGRTSSQAVKRMWINTNTKIEVVLMTTPKGHWHSNDPAHIMVNQEVWDFCKRYSIDGLIVSANNEVSSQKASILKFEYFNLLGHLMMENALQKNAIYVKRILLSDGTQESNLVTMLK